MKKLGGVLFLWTSLCMATCAFAQERTIEWESLTVHARLDADGALHVTERHAMVFDGAWNGGERTFQVRQWQSLTLVAVREIDLSTQEARPMQSGDLSRIGDYQKSGKVLRWRSRLPTDPPFVNTTKIYELEYVLKGVLIAEKGIYRFEHDLAFPDRSGMIRRFEATLQLDPVWIAPNLPTSWRRENLPAGTSEIVYAELRYTGARQPVAIARGVTAPTATPAPAVRYTLLTILIAFATLQLIALLRREHRNGRFEPTVPLERIDEHWLRENVFDRPPEVVGAAWDRDTSASEVAALLARLAQAGALKTRVNSTGAGWFKRETLHMELLWDRAQFAAHERALIDALFFYGERVTDTKKIKRLYAKKGFSPAALIKKSVEAQLPMVFSKQDSVPHAASGLSILLWMGAVGAFAGAALQMPSRNASALLVPVFVLLVGFVAGLKFAISYRTHIDAPRTRLLRTLSCVAFIGAIAAFVLLSGRVPLAPLGTVSIVMLALACMSTIFNAMRAPDVRESLDLRRRLASARIYFEHELAKPQPQLKDEWFPYLIAFGLGRHIDRWFKSIAPVTVRTASRDTSAGGSNIGGSSSSASSTWTGGGGTFGGAGASGSWSSAVIGIATNVSKSSPSSSRGGGRSHRSSGGSSRSSGGGGGGGW